MPEHLILADLHCLHLYPLGVSVREIRCCSTTRPDLRSRSPTWNSQSLFRWLDNIVVVHGEKYYFCQLTVEACLIMVCMVRIVVLRFLVALAVVFATRVWIFRVWGRGFLCWCRWPMSCRIISNQQSAVESGQDRAVRDSRPSVSERAA